VLLTTDVLYAMTDLEIYVSDDAETFTKVIDEEIEHRAGDFLFDVTSSAAGKPVEANFVKFTIVCIIDVC
jgi:hypothetical protein